MKNLAAKIACGLLTVCLCTGFLAECGGESEPIDGTAEAIRINGTSVNAGTANFFLRYQQATMISYYAMFQQDTSGVWNEEVDGVTSGESFKEDIFDTIQKMYLLKEHAQEYGVSLSEEEIAAADAAAEEFMAANDEETLTTLGVTKEDVSEVLQLYAYQMKMYDPMVADTDTNVSDEEAAQSSITLVKISTDGTEKDEDGNTIELTDEEKAAKKDQAQQIIDAVSASENPASADMDAIAKGIDEGLAAAQQSFGQNDEDSILDEKVVEAAKALSDGQICAEVVEGSDGAYYVVRMDQTLDREKTDAEKETIVSDRKNAHYTEVLQGWQDEAEVETTKAWDSLEVKDEDAYTLKQQETEETGETDAAAEDGTADTEADTEPSDTAGETGSEDGDSTETDNGAEDPGETDGAAASVE